MIKAIYFDLDGTLLNRTQSLKTWLSHVYQVLHPACPYQQFEAYFLVQDNDGYNRRESVFTDVIQHFHLETTIEWLMQNFHATCWETCVWEDGAREVLEQLHGHYRLGIITNGSVRVQSKKMAALGMAKWVNDKLISEAIGIKKPHKMIFDRAVDTLHIQHDEMLYIGDHYENDYLGAKQAGLQARWYTRRQQHGNEGETITNLHEIVTIVSPNGRFEEGSHKQIPTNDEDMI